MQLKRQIPKSNKLKTIFIYLIIWLITLVLVSIWTFENPDKIELIKNIYKKNTTPISNKETKEIVKIEGNSFFLNYEKIISLSQKTSFLLYEKNNKPFNPKLLKIYTQNGYLISNLIANKIKLPESFTLQRNGGVKTVFVNNKNKYALISNNKGNCFYASIVELKQGNEIFKTKCLPDDKKKADFNGLGSSNAHNEKNIYLSIGTPTQYSKPIYDLAQKDDSVFGKIIEIKKSSLNNSKFEYKIFSKGHRNPQGLTILDNKILSVEHGPKGGDELNLIENNKNYGWPLVSYGTRYTYDNKGKSYKINHEAENFVEPLIALVPSVGISSINTCPKILKNYYKKNCLMALSLYGNNLMPGRSIIIFLLNETLDKVNSFEKIYLGKDMKLRHFVTNEKNELYEDKQGNIYVSADLKGIYKISFSDFR